MYCFLSVFRAEYFFSPFFPPLLCSPIYTTHFFSGVLSTAGVESHDFLEMQQWAQRSFIQESCIWPSLCGLKSRLCPVLNKFTRSKALLPTLETHMFKTYHCNIVLKSVIRNQTNGNNQQFCVEIWGFMKINNKYASTKYKRTNFIKNPGPVK